MNGLVLIPLMMFLRLFAVFFVCISCLAFVGCSDAPSKAEVVAEPVVEAAPEPVAKTTGVLHYDGLPPGSVAVAEVLIVEKLSDAGRERIERQRELLENKITGRAEQTSETSALADVSATDAAHLVGTFNQLSTEFPPVLIKDIDLGNNRLRKYQSDRELHKEYQYLFRSVQWDNFERGLKFIAEKIQADNQALVKQADALESEDDRYQQIRVTLDWLESIRAQYNGYVKLATDYFEAKNRYIQAQVAAQSASAEPQDWDAYAVAYANLLVMDTAGFLLGAAFAAEDGSFEVEGHGIVVVRAELAGTSAYFIPGSEKEKRVWIENLQQF